VSNPCKICSSPVKEIFSRRIINRYDVHYFQCSKCGFVQTEEPYWLEEAYSRPINMTDTGYMVRNIHYYKIISLFLSLLFKKKDLKNNLRFLDYAGGYGIFVRIMRDAGYNYYWHDKYTKNLLALGFEGDLNSNYGAVTLFEVFEHFIDPIKEVEEILKITDTVIFSTEVVSNPPPNPDDWWYYGCEHGQHISFYTRESLHYLAENFGMNYSGIDSLHFFTKKKVPKIFLWSLKLAEFGFHRIVSWKLKSKVWDDYEFCKKYLLK